MPPMGDPEKDAREAKRTRNLDALERMLDGAVSLDELKELIKDLSRYIQRAADFIDKAPS